MGYNTNFDGAVTVTPPLNEAEIAYLNSFSCTRHAKRKGGPYATAPAYTLDESIIDDLNHDGKPGYWCHWVPTEDGTAITFDEGEKFYDGAEWMQYLIDHFLKPGAHARGRKGFADFTFDHTVNGTIDAQGEEVLDSWTLAVTDNKVTVEARW